MLERQNLSYSEYTTRLARKIDPAKTIEWWEPKPQLWIAESTALRDTIYPPATDETTSLGYSYQFQHIGTAERRLQQAGVRLAAYLEWLFRTVEEPVG